ncbi:MAG: glycoside hydrolase family 15 protein [Phycisphaerales bacterium]|nr:glycoside hydrolase family 15 protein [Phycisphaerales bacterium]
MPRDIPVGNGSLLITFDDLYRIRDIYSPRVGRHNHTNGHVQRFGVWVDGQMAWIEDEGWHRDLRYKPDSLTTEVVLTHHNLGIEVICNDVVDIHQPVYFRRMSVRDLAGKSRDVRVFFHCDLSINGSPVGDTANYDPTTRAVILYKDDAYFLINTADQNKAGVEHWAIGAKRVGGAEGTWRDAEDGQLGRNAISQGSVDATVGVNLQVKPFETQQATIWVVCTEDYESAKHINQRIWEIGPDRIITRTEAYWKLWSRKEPISIGVLPEPVQDLFYSSELILRTQIDNGGAIIAANDSDITHFAGDHYSYCWMRDGALVAHGLILAGQSELSRNFFRFAARCIGDKPYFLHKYTPEGNLASSWHPWTLDGHAILPIQQDETALTVWALRKHYEAFRDVEFIKELYLKLVVLPAQWMLEHRDHNGLPLQSWDLWEERRGIHTFTVAATIGALMAASRFASDFGEMDRAASFREGAERMKGALRRHMWHKERQQFARMAVPLEDGSYRLDMTRDSANFALFAFDAFEPDDPMIESEMNSLRDRLWVKTDVGGCARYERDYYHQVETENTEEIPVNPWVICTLWQAQFQIAKAKTLTELRLAVPLLEWAVARALPSGVLAEQFDPYSGAPMSVSPLTWSHATVVATCVMYTRKHDELMARQNSGHAPNASNTSKIKKD